MGMIQVRNVPEELGRELKERAVRAGMSLSDYLLREVRVRTERPTMDEALARIRELKPARSAATGAQLVRELRDENG